MKFNIENSNWSNLNNDLQLIKIFSLKFKFFP